MYTHLISISIYIIYMLDISTSLKRSEPVDFILMKGLFFLLLTICGNFFAPILNCNLQHLLTHNIYSIHIIIIIILYFMLTSFSATVRPPFEHMLDAIIVWTLFIIFSKTSLYFSKVIMFLLATLLICKDYITYYKSFNLIKYDDTIAYLSNAFNYGIYVIILTTIIGFIIYFKKQYRDHYKTFSILTFLLGTVTCDSMKRVSV